MGMNRRSFLVDNWLHQWDIQLEALNPHKQSNFENYAPRPQPLRVQTWFGERF